MSGQTCLSHRRDVKLLGWFLFGFPGSPLKDLLYQSRDRRLLCISLPQSRTRASFISFLSPAVLICRVIYIRALSRTYSIPGLYQYMKRAIHYLPNQTERCLERNSLEFHAISIFLGGYHRDRHAEKSNQVIADISWFWRFCHECPLTFKEFK